MKCFNNKKKDNFSYAKNVTNFEAFYLVILSSVNLFRLHWMFPIFSYCQILLYILIFLVFSGLKRMTSSCSILQEVLICRTLLEDNTFGHNNPGNSSAGQLWLFFVVLSKVLECETDDDGSFGEKRGMYYFCIYYLRFGIFHPFLSNQFCYQYKKLVR